MPACSSNVSVDSSAALAAAAQVLIAGGLVVYPTETVYGLGADASNATALERLVGLKGRAPGQPISVLIADLDMLPSLVDHVPTAAMTLMRHFWPGPLTIVLEARPGLRAPLTAGTGTIGVRVSSHALATALVRACGRPITTPSANPAGCRPPTRVDEARAYFGTNVDVYLDGGVLTGEPPSTVVDVRTTVRVLRAGAVSTAAIRQALSGSC
jgi:L-threonylcarbamoyladenylate synthase